MAIERQKKTKIKKAKTIPIMEVVDIAKHYGNIIALTGVSAPIHAGEITCVLGDNGAGKSTLIKILSGVHQQSAGDFFIDGKKIRLSSPRDALSRGIATVYQDLAMAPLMAIWRNFFLGSEPTTGVLPFRFFNIKHSKNITHGELHKMGIDIRDIDQPVGTLSGGERQSVAIARAVYFGARVLILDEPTAALGVKQAGVVLRYVLAAKKRGLGVILITHNPHHAFPVGDRFLLLSRGKCVGYYKKNEITIEKLTQSMAGGAELSALTHELEHAKSV